MIQASILDQITTFFNILINNQNIILIGIIALFTLLLLVIASKFNGKKITKILCAMVYLGIFGTLFYIYKDEVLALFDYLFNNIFLFLFFPNLAVYILVLVIINFIIIKSTFSKKDSKVIKYMNILFFLVFNVIFYLIIDTILNNNIDVYEQLSIYTNNDLLILVELSMKLFIVWLLVLGIIKISISLSKNISFKKSSKLKLALEETSNKEEIKGLKEVKDYMEVIPAINEDDLIMANNSQNRYIDIIPIKKRYKLTDNLKFKEVINNNIEENKLFIVENKINKDNDVIINNVEEDNVLVKCSDDIKEKKPSIFDNFDVIDIKENNYKFIPNIEVLDLDQNNESKIDNTKPIITLSSYDSIFIENNENLENNVSQNMEIVFNDNNEYMKNILIDIEDLKNNKSNPKKLEKIYNDVKNKQNELTLKDYDNLINALLEVKKA